METIIRAAAVASAPRQLRRASDRNQKPQSTAPMMAPQASIPQQVAVTVPDVSVAFAQPVAAAQTATLELEVRRQVQFQVEQELVNTRAQIALELENARAEAERKGFAAGLEKGEEAARNTVTEQVVRLASVAAILHQARADVIAGAEDTLVEIAYTAVCRIVGETAVTHEAVASMVHHVVANFRERDQLLVRLHPQDFDLLLQAQEAVGVATLIQQISMRPDPSIRFGGCMVESDSGYLDARLETQLSRLCETLLSIRKGRESSEEQL